MKRSEMEITSTDLLASLVEECRKLVDASGLEGGAGGGWDAYDDLLTELRKRLKASESHLANVSGGGARSMSVPFTALLAIVDQIGRKRDIMLEYKDQADEQKMPDWVARYEEIASAYEEAIVMIKECIANNSGLLRQAQKGASK